MARHAIGAAKPFSAVGRTARRIGYCAPSGSYAVSASIKSRFGARRGDRDSRHQSGGAFLRSFGGAAQRQTAGAGRRTANRQPAVVGGDLRHSAERDPAPTNPTSGEFLLKCVNY